MNPERGCRLKTKKPRVTPRKNETVEIIVDAIGRVQVKRITGPQSSRIVVVMDLEDDKLGNSADSKQ